MQNKIFRIFYSLSLFGVISFSPAFSAETGLMESEDEEMISEDVSANAVQNYNVDNSMFQQMTNLEQEKVLKKLEKERAQLDLDIDKLAAEKIRLGMEMEELADKKQSKELNENVKESEPKDEKQDVQESDVIVVKPEKTEDNKSLNQKYKLIDIIGSGQQLQSTLQDLSNGGRRRISVGKEIDGYIVKSISLYDGVSFEKDGKTEILNVGKESK